MHILQKLNPLFLFIVCMPPAISAVNRPDHPLCVGTSLAQPLVARRAASLDVKSVPDLPLPSKPLPLARDLVDGYIRQVLRGAYACPDVIRNLLVSFCRLAAAKRIAYLAYALGKANRQLGSLSVHLTDLYPMVLDDQSGLRVYLDRDDFVDLGDDRMSAKKEEARKVIITACKQGKVVVDQRNASYSANPSPPFFIQSAKTSDWFRERLMSAFCDNSRIDMNQKRLSDGKTILHQILIKKEYGLLLILLECDRVAGDIKDGDGRLPAAYFRLVYTLQERRYLFALFMRFSGANGMKRLPSEKFL